MRGAMSTSSAPAELAQAPSPGQPKAPGAGGIAGGSTPQPLRYTSGLRYADRAEKALYIADKYTPLLTGSVLDVGCDQAPLRRLVLRADRYTGVDILPTADYIVDLDKQNLPFADRSYDTVVCTDVLEHLERCHAVFDELCRVAAHHIIVSLPNPLRVLLMGLYEGSAGRSKFYGLPVDPPADRHRWFFGRDEAAAFLTERGRRNGFAVEQLDDEEGGCYPWRDRSGTDVLAASNVRGGTLWCLLARERT
jgi:hypothetical protein